MDRRGYRLVVYLVLLVAVASGIRLLHQELLGRRVIPAGEKVFCKTVYTLCGHEKKTTISAQHRGKLTVRELRELYPPKDGWLIKWAEHEIEISKSTAALCPSCQKKSHLGRKGDFVAVIRGPVGVDGGVIRVTSVRLSNLPLSIRRQVEKGRLDVPDEKALMQILDSLEEDTE